MSLNSPTVILDEFCKFAILTTKVILQFLFQFKRLSGLGTGLALVHLSQTVLLASSTLTLAKSSFTKCALYNQTGVSLSATSNRELYLKNLERHAKQAYPDLAIKIKSSFKKVRDTSIKDPGYQRQMESLSLVLNEAYQVQGVQNAKIWKFWELFASSRRRAPEAKEKRQICIETSTTEFKNFRKKLVDLLFYYFNSNQIFHHHLNYLKLNIDKIYAAGELNYFGATVSQSTRNSIRLCINPEEAPPLLLPKMIHEITHATNKTLQSSHKAFKEIGKAYKKQVQLQDAAFDKLLEIEEHLKADSPIELDLMMDLLAKKSSIKQKELIETMRRRLGGLNPFKNKNLNTGIELYANALVEWKEKDKDQKSMYRKFLSAGINLDQLRFIDEHRAYAYELIAAWHLIDQFPNQFCSLWVPSFQLKRPARFPHVYLNIENLIKKNQVGKFLKKHYVDTGSYLTEAIMDQKPTGSQIKESLLSRGTNEIELVLKEYFNNPDSETLQEWTVNT